MNRPIALATLAAIMLLAARPSLAFNDGRWCAVTSTGFSGSVERCHFQTFEECRVEITGGARGFCQQNPGWAGNARPPAKPAAARKNAKP